MVNEHELIYALSDALDLVGVDDSDHGKRVAYMALECAEALNLRENDKVQLFHAALLHDCGVSSTKIHNLLVYTLDWDGAEDHCIRGYQLLNLSPTLSHLSQIILYHHTYWSDLKKLNIDFLTSSLANLIFLVDRVDALMAQHRKERPNESVLHIAETVKKEIQELANDFFSPELVDAFLETSSREVFWFTLQQESLHNYLNQYIASLQSETLDLSSMRNIAELFAYFVDAKSPYTADHSLDVAMLAKFISQKMGLPAETTSKIEIAGLLHDVGKLKVPDEILDKPGPLDDDEFDVIKIHAYETHEILSRVKGLEDITDWASNHHEKINGQGYPYHNKAEQLAIPARIITIADIFQALAQKRPYRNYMKPIDILDILKSKAEQGEIDKDIVAVVENNLQNCWEISIKNSRKI